MQHIKNECCFVAIFTLYTVQVQAYKKIIVTQNKYKLLKQKLLAYTNTLPNKSIFLPYPTLPFPTLPNPTLPYPTLPYPTLPYPTLPYLTIPYPTFLCIVRNKE